MTVSPRGVTFYSFRSLLPIQTLMELRVSFLLLLNHTETFHVALEILSTSPVFALLESSVDQMSLCWPRHDNMHESDHE